MSSLHRDKRATHNFSVILEVTRRLWTKWEANPARKPGGHPRVGVGTPPVEPIIGELVDPASTAFEDE
jgi:hypothetical protein